MLINNDFFLGMSVAMGIFSAYVQELFVRRDFINTDIIVQAKRVSDELRIHAEAANKAKSEFFAVMSHELRTPLNAILGFSELMQQRVFGPLGSERYAAYVDDIHGTGKHLLNIITDILDLSKAEAGKLTLSEEVVDVGEVLGQCLHLLRERAAEQELVLFLTLPPERVHLRADARLLKQVTINLLNNAIKFTPTGGTVEVALEIAEDGGCSVRVTDTGIGIAEEDLSRVLEPFVQVESAFVRKHGGTGLGLALVPKVTELHGATVSISSALGAGTTIVIAFPAERLAALAQAPASAKVA
jgi:two-component system cell cycle sensor histidine kinase PleC